MSSPIWVTRNKDLSQHEPALTWSGGSHIRFETAQFLAHGSFPASLCIIVDDIAVGGLYSQMTRKSADRQHNVLRLSLKPVLDDLTVHKIRDLFEARKANLFRADQTFVDLRDGINALALNIWSQSRRVWNLERAHFAGFRWAFHAYSMLVAPWSPVSLIVSSPGFTSRRGFGVFAACDLSENEYIWELAGMLSTDYNNQHTGLSVVNHPKKTTLHILFGPIRLVNHDCKANAEFAHIEIGDKNGFTLQTNRVISTGEEILVNYGKSYDLGSEFGGPCPCRSCNATRSGSSPNSQRPLAVKRAPVINVEEQREAKRLKSADRRAKRSNYIPPVPPQYTPPVAPD